MKSRKNIYKLRIINALLFAVIFFVQYNSVFSIKIAQANPMLPLALLVTVCMFCSEVTAAISGLIVGIFMDTAAATPQGFNAVTLMVLGLMASLIVRHLFNNNLLSSLALCSLCTVAYYLLRWIVCLAFSASLTENLTYLMQTAFPSVIYTAIFAVPFYYLERALYNKFYK
ncbi:MAG: rod shape-determining protein MreD [Clostridia bacterium]|nr:rod shape-determining protein MreD [Clostridia bacterium]